MRRCATASATSALELDQKTRIVPLSQGVDYLGFRLCVTGTGKVVRRLRTGNKRRVKAKLKRHGHAYREGKIGLEDASRGVRSCMAHLDRGLPAAGTEPAGAPGALAPGGRGGA